MNENTNSNLEPGQPNWPDRESIKEIIAGVKELGKDYFNSQLQSKEKEYEIEKEIIQVRKEHQTVEHHTEWKKFVTLIIFFAFCIIVAASVFLIKDLPPALNSIICFIAGYTAALVLSSNKKQIHHKDNSEDNNF